MTEKTLMANVDQLAETYEKVTENWRTSIALCCWCIFLSGSLFVYGSLTGNSWFILGAVVSLVLGWLGGKLVIDLTRIQRVADGNLRDAMAEEELMEAVRNVKVSLS